MSTTIVNKEGDYKQNDPPIIGTLRHALSLPTPRKIIITVKHIELIDFLSLIRPYVNLQSAVGTTIKAAPQIAIFSGPGRIENIHFIPGSGNWRTLLFIGTSSRNWEVKYCTSESLDDDGFCLFQGANRIRFYRCVIKGQDKGSLVDGTILTPCTNITYEQVTFNQAKIRTPANDGIGLTTIKNCVIYVTKAGSELGRAGSTFNLLHNFYFGQAEFSYYPARVQVDIDLSTPNQIYKEGNRWFVNGIEREFKVGTTVDPTGISPVPDLLYSPTMFPYLLPDLTGVPV